MLALPRIGSLVRLMSPGPRRGRAILVLLAASLLAGGCGDRVGSLDEDTYVQVMAHLNYARERYANTAEDDSARAAVLEEFGVSGPQVEEFTSRHGSDPQLMNRLWERIRREVEVLHGVQPPESQADDAGNRPGERRGGR
ncbi:hypothetical protein [Candidatus Palauibacter sp.]|uniref:hypothetical protein n=1 Tax=Candidatus Palauibacter sp. TaxID=3101350 RepID=UPI003AF24FE2